MREMKVTGELYEGEWLDIGTPQRLELLNAQLINRY
jgi:MurNAc alpha-1-phosphate uridylyltransferase